MDIERAPACCRQSMSRIQEILEAGGCLAEILAIAPSISRPTFRLSTLGLLWRLGSGGANYIQNREQSRRLVNQIIRSRIALVIDLEIVRHASDRQSELAQHWTRLREAF
jgi:hypothetical protein